MNTTPTLQIAVLDRGFVYVGFCQIKDDMLTITNARCIRRWGTTKGLGQLATTGPTDATELDVPCTVQAPLKSVIHMIDCNPSHWPEITVAQAA